MQIGFLISLANILPAKVVRAFSRTTLRKELIRRAHERQVTLHERGFKNPSFPSCKFVQRFASNERRHKILLDKNCSLVMKPLFCHTLEEFVKTFATLPGYALGLAALFFTLTIPACSHTQAQTPTYAALVTDLTGTVLVRKVGRTDFARAVWGMQLYRGDQIRTQEHSQVSLLLMNRNLIVLESGSTLTIQGNSTLESTKGVKALSSDLAVNLSGLTLHESRTGDAAALSGLRSGAAAPEILPCSPRSPKLRSSRPAFVWESKQKYDSYKIAVLTDSGAYWTRKSSASRLDYPPDAPALKDGSTYFWHVEGEGLFEQIKSPTVRFTVLSSQEIKSIQDQEQRIRQTIGSEADNSSLHFLLGAHYDQAGLWEEAVSQFEIIAAKNVDAPLPHEILGRLYEKLDMKDQAITELQKAVQLSQERR
jgi:hypothetical protein